jgi:hypothetical protein
MWRRCRIDNDGGNYNGRAGHNRRDHNGRPDHDRSDNNHY